MKLPRGPRDPERALPRALASSAPVVTRDHELFVCLRIDARKGWRQTKRGVGHGVLASMLHVSFGGGPPPIPGMLFMLVSREALTLPVKQRIDEREVATFRRT